VSVETIEEEYEYVRHHGSWKDFNENLQAIKSLDHKISFNMLHFILNYKSIYNCIDFLKRNGFNDNSFIAGPLHNPKYLNTLNLPRRMMDKVLLSLREKLSQRPQGYLKNSFENLLSHYSTTQFESNIQAFYSEMDAMDQRRNQNGRAIFTDLFKELDAYTLE
jgi:MoaA/NifB/PqqE/SkfB family radical SAM enzyme